MDDIRKRIDYKTLTELTEQWDNICESREEIIEQGLDVSLMYVTSPCVLEEVKKENPKTILDVGCGTGYLTACLSQYAPTIGIDCSKKSIDIANNKYSKKGLCFLHNSIESYSPTQYFDLCTANMVFSCDPNWKKSLVKIHKMLSANGCILIVLPHPCFWPQNWGILNKEWFDYKEEMFIEHDFSITFAKSLGTSTYIHRPFENYINGCIESGFSIEKIKEPYPVISMPDGYQYKFPRFFMIKARKHSVIIAKSKLGNKFS